MDRKEREIIDRIKDRADEIKAADSLSPDHVKEMLEGKKQKKRLRPYQVTALAAACLAVVIAGAVWGSRDGTPDKSKPSGSRSSQISDSKQIASANSYDEIYEYIERYQKEMKTREFVTSDSGTKTLESTAPDNASGNASSAPNAGTKSSDAGVAHEESAEYSRTNVRQEGVEEGDVVKTDGKYLYVLKDSRQEVSIVKADGKDMEEAGSIKADDASQIQEIYLQPDSGKLVLICSKFDVLEDGDYPSGRGFYNTQSVEAVTYDVRDASSPREEGRVTQSGNYSSSRMANGYLYLFSEFYTGQELRKSEPGTFVPMVNGEVLAKEDIFLPPVLQANMYEVITSVDLDHPKETKDSKAIFSNGGQAYVSNENIYFYETQWGYPKGDTTTVRKVAYKNGELKAIAQGKFDGYLKDSFCIDEYEGNLRVVTTKGDDNSVYVLDKNLEVIGSMEGLAEDEQVYSARFMGDTGYFMTFRQMDPLFSVDLSDPKNPKILGALKIPGFSEYLHFYGEDRLLGIGMDVDEKAQSTDGIKLTMFDISNKADVKEADTYVLENVYSTDVSYDYKAALVDQERNLIGFAGYTQGGRHYYLFSYDDNSGFVCNMDEEINGNGVQGARGVYIEEVLYVVQGNIIEAYSLEDYKKIGDIIL